MSTNVMSTGPKLSPIVPFLVELRTRLICSLIVFFTVFAVLLYFANDLYAWLALPLLKFLPHGQLIATHVFSPFLVPFKLAFMVSFVLTAPFFLFQLWAFVSPALYGHEKRMIWPILWVSVALFYVGIAFAYFVIFPMMFRFVAHVVPEHVILSPDIGAYLDVVLKLLLVFGGLFEIPIIMVLLVKANLTSQRRFIVLRPYAILGSFVVSMCLAPPDIVSQAMLAVPIWLLYESGIILSRFA